MDEAIQILRELENQLANEVEASFPIDSIDQISFLSIGELIHVRWYGDYFNAFRLFEVLRNPIIASRLGSLLIEGPDTAGANGTRNLNLNPLIEGEVHFPVLTRFAIARNALGDHNRSVIGDTYEEDGMLATLLSKSPQLEELYAPSAPNSAFFNAGSRPIKILGIDAGYDTQDFIRNLARSSCFPKLYCLEFGEYNERYDNDWRDQMYAASRLQGIIQFHRYGPSKTIRLEEPHSLD